MPLLPALVQIELSPSWHLNQLVQWKDNRNSLRS